MTDSKTLIEAMIAALHGGSLRVIDLTKTLNAQTPIIQLPPDMAPLPPVEIETIANFDERGAYTYLNKITFAEHAGTHFDAPNHWISGRDYADGATDTIPVDNFISEACVIDLSAEAANDEDFLMEPEHVLAWEKVHGEIPEMCWVLMRTDWSKRSDAADFLNMREDGA
ncbi:MAG: cyclase family protein, partial [Parvularculaceae bacterium]|nr:cyclase family protein [Parvularculaceae bacterium]